MVGLQLSDAEIKKLCEVFYCIFRAPVMELWSASIPHAISINVPIQFGKAVGPPTVIMLTVLTHLLRTKLGGCGTILRR